MKKPGTQKNDSKLGWTNKIDRINEKAIYIIADISHLPQFTPQKLHPLKLLTISARAEYVPIEEQTTPTIIIVMQSAACRHMKQKQSHTIVYHNYTSNFWNEY